MQAAQASAIPMESPGEIISTPNERILALDVLRGFALFGILYCHLFLWYAAGALPESLFENMSVLSKIAGVFYGVLFTAKFFSIFSFLFGMSFYIQLETLARKGDNPALRFAWRLSILLFIGTLHTLFWRADILSIYAPLGFLLIFCRHLSNKALLIIGGLLVLNIPTVIAQLICLMTTGDHSFFHTDNNAQGIHYLNIMQHANFFEMVSDNFYGTKEKMQFQLESGRLLMTFGFFLLGMLVSRLGWFHQLVENRSKFLNIWKKSWKIALSILLLMLVTSLIIYASGVNMKDNKYAQFPFIIFMNLFHTAITAFYISGVALLMMQPNWVNRLSSLAYIGKMALTTYLTQSIVCVFLFFGIGLNWVGKTSLADNIGICFIIFGLQILFSRWWLQHFQYGPVEYLWRSATFLRWQPFKK